ncbi:hypothetical protein O6H91_09G035600 [Diphasiastrum complanatum]|uniref:Uncharacterized protein n=2 Tax=Diphasiastrum complanatum TaxID=34168 RepID=A0ACC2CN93_DIPCM|nr:hypothetical protein O6H91_09G035600 [Diphasiastrum complanatum]KAJ7543385.1 hypothetical protein O6H91_09G035600 [Diphasiastrum complanatum]
MDVNETGQAFSASSEPLIKFVELGQEYPLPYGWERCLDLKSGLIHFIDRITGMKTDADPREKHTSRSSHFSVGVRSSTILSVTTTKHCDVRTRKRSKQRQVQKKIAVNERTKDMEDPPDARGSTSMLELSSWDSIEPSNAFTSPATSSAVSSTSFWGDEDHNPEINSHSLHMDSKNTVEGTASVMVTMGCTCCYMYMMLSKTDVRCPRCGGTSLITFTKPHKLH